MKLESDLNSVSGELWLKILVYAQLSKGLQAVISVFFTPTLFIFNQNVGFEKSDELSSQIFTPPVEEISWIKAFIYSIYIY